MKQHAPQAMIALGVEASFSDLSLACGRGLLKPLFGAASNSDAYKHCGDPQVATRIEASATRITAFQKSSLYKRLIYGSMATSEGKADAIGMAGLAGDRSQPFAKGGMDGRRMSAVCACSGRSIHSR